MASERSRVVTRRFTFAALVTVTLLAAASPAFAEPSLSDRETARALMDEGDAKREKNDLRGALKAYEAADAIMKVPTTGLEVARAQAALGLLLEARETLARVMRIAPKPGEPAAFVTARKQADALNAELATRIPSITVVVTNAEPGSTPQIVFDGETVPPAAAQAPRKVNPGKHAIIVRAGSAEKLEEVSVVEKDAKTLTVDLAKHAPPPTATKPPADDAAAPSEGDGSTWKVVMISGFAVGAIGIGVGSVTGIMSMSKVSDVKDVCDGNSCPSNRKDDIDSAKDLGTISTIAFVAGGVGVALGVTGLLLSGKSSSEPAAPVGQSAALRVRPVVSPTFAGLTGSF